MSWPPSLLQANPSNDHMHQLGPTGRTVAGLTLCLTGLNSEQAVRPAEINIETSDFQNWVFIFVFL